VTEAEHCGNPRGSRANVRSVLWKRRDHITFDRDRPGPTLLEALLKIAQTPPRISTRLPASFLSLRLVSSTTSETRTTHAQWTALPDSMMLCHARPAEQCGSPEGWQREERVVEKLNHAQRPSRSSGQPPRVPGRASGSSRSKRAPFRKFKWRRTLRARGDRIH
jgi:hypothetical protein